MGNSHSDCVRVSKRLQSKHNNASKWPCSMFLMHSLRRSVPIFSITWEAKSMDLGLIVTN